MGKFTLWIGSIIFPVSDYYTECHKYLSVTLPSRETQ